ncbi:hypothetical protein FRB90_000063 [Tulasnella sp. 427]|nr:hypothetical protein FRB90_000063 [Tulasnella sp. 427]
MSEELNGPPTPITPYTACYCEENVYLLGEALKRLLPTSAKIFAVIVSNPTKSIAVWQQLASQYSASDGFLVVWDYHVILCLKMPDTGDVWVYDADTRLGSPCRWDRYTRETFASELIVEASDPEDVPIPELLRCNQLRISEETGEKIYVSPPPDYPCILGTEAARVGKLNTLMDEWVDMTAENDGHGIVLSDREFLKDAMLSSVMGSGKVQSEVLCLLRWLKASASPSRSFVLITLRLISHLVALQRVFTSPSALSSPMQAPSSHYGTNGTTNGVPHIHINGVNGIAGPSKGYPPTPPSTHPGTSTPVNGSETNGAHYADLSHNDTIVNHIYTAGFQHGNYSDTLLHILNHQYRLHAIILSRSPYLAHLINTAGSNSIHVPIESEPLITEEGFAIALGYLYSSISLRLITPQNALSVLASACLLGGMDDLCARAYEACKEHITPETINEWIQFLDVPPSPSPSNPSTPIGMSPVATSPITPSLELFGPTAILGPYARRLCDDLLTFITATLPKTLQAFPAKPSTADSESGHDALLRIYSTLPFHIFKLAVESSNFPVGIGGEQIRFRFVKEAIAARKKTKAGRVAEESVVLAFGKTDGGSAVHVTRKMKKRPLWKVAK